MQQEKSQVKNSRKMQGFVVRKSSEMTIVVEVRTDKRHKLYGKKTKSTKKYLVHDGKNSAKVGEEVEIAECKPISKRKRWTLIVPEEKKQK